MVNNNILQAIKESNFSKKNNIQTKSIIGWNKSTQKRNQVNNIKNTAMQDYIDTLLTDDVKQPKHLFNSLVSNAKQEAEEA